jgi:1-acyl-sn-glycerol-3-phosphate acyltransferase
MLDMGGIPIDRTKRANTVEQMKAEFDRRKELALVIAAEGTRKSGRQVEVGLLQHRPRRGGADRSAFADNEKMTIGFSQPMMPTGNYGEDLLKIAEWFRSKIPDLERYKVLEQQARDIIAGKNDI